MASNILFCDITKNNQGSICLEGLQTFFTPDFIPGLFSFGMTIIISGYDWNRPHRIRVELRDPDSNELLSLEDSTPILEFHEQVPEKYRALIGAWQLLNVKIQSEGTYKVRFYVDGVLDGEQELYLLENRK